MQTLIGAIEKYNLEEISSCASMEIDAVDFLLPTDLNIWAGREVLTANDFADWVDLHQVHSDVMEDINGTRPNYIPETLSELREDDEYMTNYLLNELRESEAYEREQRREAAVHRKEKEKAIRKRRSDNFGSMMFGDNLLEALVAKAR